MKHKLFQKKIEIERWLDNCEIENYELVKDSLYGFVVDVTGSVFLSSFKSKTIDVKFNVVLGNFTCWATQLTSLRGCPEAVVGSFDCSGNYLVNLLDAPKEVAGDFNCSSNQLVTLEGIAKNIKSLNCESNQLTHIDSIYFAALENFNFQKNPLPQSILQANSVEELKRILERDTLHFMLDAQTVKGKTLKI